MQQQKLAAMLGSLELSPSNVAAMAELIGKGKANLEVVVYPWGVEFVVSSPYCSTGDLEGGEGDGV